MKKNIFLLIFNLIVFFIFSQTQNDGFYFDGVDDFINVGAATNTNINNINRRTTNNRTYETWFRADEVSSRQFIMKEGAGIRAIAIYIENGFLIVGGYNRADYTPRWEGTYFRKAITANTWYHVALVLDNALAANTTSNPMGANQNTALKFYLDGTLIGENSGYQLGGHNTMRLGYRDAGLQLPPSNATWTSQLSSEFFFTSTAVSSVGGNDYFQGYLWGFRLWNRVRTPQEIDDFKSDIITTVGQDNLVAILDGDTFTYLNNDNTTTSNADVSPVDTVVWSDTAASSDWNTGSNWVGGIVPSQIEKEAVVIQASTNYPVLTSGTHIVTGDLQVDLNASITIESGGTLEVSYDVVNEGEIFVEDSGSLVIREKKILGGSGTYFVQRLTPTYGGNDFYSYWSTPVIGSDSNIATVFSDAELIYMFNASQNDSDWFFVGTANFQTGLGYAVQHEGVGGNLRTFSGLVNSGDITIDIYNTTNVSGQGSDGNAWSDEGDNLIGNPYPAAIDWDLVITDPDNQDLSGEIYFWDQQNAEIGENNVNEYVVYNLTGASVANSTTNGNIGTGQGFFVKSNVPDPTTLTFKTTHQVPANNNNFYKIGKTKEKSIAKKQGRSWLTFNRKEKTNTLLVGFLDGATNGFDRIYDAPHNINEKSLGFYSLTDSGDKLTIQGLPELTQDEKIVKLGFVVDELGEHTIGIQEEHIGDEYFIYLKDTQNNITTDLRATNYTFMIDNLGENNTRFEVVYLKNQKAILSVDDSSTTNQELIIFTNSSKELIVKQENSLEIKKISLFNILGEEIKTFYANKKNYVGDLSNGVYIVKASFEGNKITTNKILISY